MQQRQIAEMYALEADHWWFWGKRLLLRRLLGNRLMRPDLRILDVGCGAGAGAIELSAYGSVVACDRSLDALGYARGRGLLRVVAASAPDLPFRSAAFDVVTAYDVLEHVEDDAAFVRELARVLAPGGALAIHVPAWPSLWSGHDEILEHKRRYTRRNLAALLQDNGLRIQSLGWASCAIFLPAVAARWMRQMMGRQSQDADLGVVPAPFNRILRGVYRAEAAVAVRFGLPFGLSLAAIATRDKR